MSQGLVIRGEAPDMVIGNSREKAANEVPVRICMVKRSRFGGGRVARATCVYHGRRIFVEVPTRGEADFIAIKLAFEEVQRRAHATEDDIMSGGHAWRSALGKAKVWVAAFGRKLCPSK